MTNTPPPDARPSLSPTTVLLKARLSPERYETLVGYADYRVSVIERTAALRATGMSHREALRTVDPSANWWTYRGWLRNAENREGVPWERQMVAILPHPPVPR